MGDLGLVLFRTDASTTIGTGHVIRCLTLAHFLAEKGAEILFVSREHDGNLCDFIVHHGFPVYRLPSPSNTAHDTEHEPAHAKWLGTKWQEDAEETSAIIESLAVKPDWLVVDHYALDSRWERTLRPFVDHILVIDDLADREHECDLLLDQNLVADMDGRYTNKVPADCRQLLGPEYALLQPIYADLHDRIPPREGDVRRILISFGGADIDNLTERSLRAILSLDRKDIGVDIVISENNPHFLHIFRLIAGHENIQLHSTLPSLAPLMAKADLAIGAAGTTSWERLCLGLPTLVITLAENQRPIAGGLQDKGLVCWLGHKDEVTEDEIKCALGKLIETGIDKEWSLHCRSVVDGKGVDRVGTVLTIHAKAPLRVRHATLSDEALILRWANDPETRKNSFSPDPIPIETHHRWFSSKLRDIDGCRLYIVETEDGIPIGQVRFEKDDLIWEIGYLLAPHFRGKKLARPMMDAALMTLRQELKGVIVIGRVKKDNIASCKVFESLGFDVQSDGGGMVYSRVL